MTILNQSRDLTKEETYFLSKAQNIRKMSSIKGQTVDIMIWIMYEDVNQKGEPQTIFSFMTPEREVYATNSQSFIRSFNDILDCFEKEDIKRIQVVPGLSNAGREFLTCVYA